MTSLTSMEGCSCYWVSQHKNEGHVCYTFTATVSPKAPFLNRDYRVCIGWGLIYIVTGSSWEWVHAHLWLGLCWLQDDRAETLTGDTHISLGRGPPQSSSSTPFPSPVSHQMLLCHLPCSSRWPSLPPSWSWLLSSLSCCTNSQLVSSIPFVTHCNLHIAIQNIFFKNSDGILSLPPFQSSSDLLPLSWNSGSSTGPAMRCLLSLLGSIHLSFKAQILF